MEINVSLFKRSSAWVTASGQRKEGWSWWARWSEPTADPVKKKDCQRSLKTQDKRLAQKMVFSLEQQLNALPVPVGDRIPRTMDWEQALTLYQKYHGQTRAVNTQVSARTAWRRLWTWLASPAGPGITKIEQLKPFMIIEWRDALGLAPNSLNAYLGYCGCVVSKLKELELYDGPNVFETVRRLREREVKKDWLDPEEVRTVVTAAGEISVDLELFCALGFYAGLRAPSEVLGVRWEWIHWPTGPTETGYIRIPLTDGDFSVKDKEARAIPLFPELARILALHRGLPGSYVVAPFKTSCASNNARWRAYKEHFKTLSAAVPGKTVTPYTMRRTFASECVRCGVELFKVMRWMGHADIKVFQRYAHLAPADNEIRKLFPAEAAR